jgi:hypothetical protein
MAVFLNKAFKYEMIYLSIYLVNKILIPISIKITIMGSKKEKL